MDMNIVIIDHEPYSFRKKSHYYIDQFLSDGWNVEYWAVNNILDYTKDVTYLYTEDDFFVRYFLNEKELLDAMWKFDPKLTIFIIEIFFNWSTLNIYKTLKRGNYSWIKIDYYFNPTEFINPPANLIDKIFNWQSSLPEKIMRFLFNIKYAKSSLDEPDILFLTGNNKIGAGKGKKIETLDYFDVEVYENLKGNASILPYKYIVFLDIFLPYHPDAQRSGHYNYINPQDYFNKINKFFDQIEKQTGYPVVIACHPKANYTVEFGSRKLFKHKTAELCIHSELILTHGSLSISFGLFAKKPLVFIYSKQLFCKNKLLKRLIFRMNVVCKYLDLPKINIDNYDETNILVKNVDDIKYSNFLNLLYLNTNKIKKESNLYTLKNNFLTLLNLN
jgi:hypothetical protein